ncbi:MAG: hypothetical protein LW832_08440 [Parachlamydia sp.]|jgi:hypothetical protein|nr:hypothetical protein [Parachlamydia sp.]
MRRSNGKIAAVAVLIFGITAIAAMTRKQGRGNLTIVLDKVAIGFLIHPPS